MSQIDYLIAEMKRSDRYSLNTWIDKILCMGDSAAKSFDEAVEDERLYLDILDCIADTPGYSADGWFTTVLRERYILLEDDVRKKAIYNPALGEGRYADEWEKAVKKLILARDCTILNELMEKRNGLMEMIESEDTSHGGTTYSQLYWQYIRLIDQLAGL